MSEWSEAEIDSIARSVAEHFIAEFHPEESPYFSLVWEKLAEPRSALLRGEKADGHGLSPDEVGLPLGGTESLTLASPFAILTVSAVLCELNARGLTPDLVQIQDAIEVSAEEFGAEEELAKTLAQEVGPQLHRLFQGKPQATMKVFQRTDEREDFVYVERLMNGMQFGPRRIPARIAKAVSQREFVMRYEILIDELGRTISVRSKTDKKLGKAVVPIPFSQISPEQCGMLWLALYRIAKGISLKEISDFFETGPDNSQVYRYRMRLKDLLGDNLRDRLLPESRKEKRYRVPLEGWSFCWIRRSADPRLSELVSSFRDQGRLHKIR